MKATTLVAATTLLGGASAGVHKMKLKKVPLKEQLESVGMNDMSRLLTQKYMSYGSYDKETYVREMFAPRSGHKVPVNNYMNAQCTILHSSGLFANSC